MLGVIALGFGAWIYWGFWGGRGGTADKALVVYCAHDSVYSQEIIDRFTEETGIAVDVKFDTEATKSLGLVERISREKSAPQCDVFWNNEILGTIRLAETACLQPYSSPSAQRIPERFKDSTGLWTGFAGRFRVFIVHSESPSGNVDSKITQLLESDDLSTGAIANPLYGTTLTHYAALWEEMGSEALKAWHAETRAKGIIEAKGNAAVKELVASGVCKWGYTDTDDTFVALDAGAPVAMAPFRLPSGKTICIPNTISMIKGCPHPESARKFVDFLLSEKTELALAHSRSRQIPLGKLSDESALPSAVAELRTWVEDATDLKSISEARNACLEWLKSL